MPWSNYLWLVTATLLAVTGVLQLDGEPQWWGWLNLTGAACIVATFYLHRSRYQRAAQKAATTP